MLKDVVRGRRRDAFFRVGMGVGSRGRRWGPEVSCNFQNLF